MLMIDKDKAMTTVMARRREKDGSTSESMQKPSKVMDEDLNADPRHEAAKDVLSAMSEKHPGKLMEAMAAFHDLHSMHPKESTDKAD